MRPRPIRLALAAGAALSLVLTGCGSSSDTGSATASSGSSDDAAFPVTIEHAFGETTIEQEPTQVVTWGFGSTDVALALGVVPVAIPEQTYGGNADGVLPWIADKLTEMGAETPAILPYGDGTTVPFEEIAAAQPDVILANYSGITAEDYQLLAQIAPTVAYPGEAWSTPWREVTTTVGKALGMEAEAEQLVADTEKTIADKAAEHPEFQGTTVAAVWDTAGTFYVYKPADARVEFLTDLGLTVAPSVEALAGSGDSTFYATVSYEQVPEITSDILVTYANTQEESDTFLAQPYAQLMPQVQSGKVATLIGAAPVMAVSPPTVLSMPWGLDDYVDAIAAAM